MEYNLFVPIFEQITIKTVSTEKVKISTWDEGLQLLNFFFGTKSGCYGQTL